MATPDTPPTPTAAAYRVRGRAAGAFTTHINYAVSGQVCVAAHRLSLRPTSLSLGNLVIGIGTSLAVIAFAGPITADPMFGLAAGLAAWLLWQAAYTLDCADGQLARVTGTSTPAGGRLDILVDIAVQIALVAAVATVAATSAVVPAWLTATFAGTWMINMVTSVMAKEGTNTSLIPRDSPAIRAVKIIRDYGAMVTVIAGVLAVRPSLMIWVMALFSTVNAFFLLASIAQSAGGSLRPGSGCLAKETSGSATTTGQ